MPDEVTEVKVIEIPITPVQEPEDQTEEEMFPGMVGGEIETPANDVTPEKLEVSPPAEKKEKEVPPEEPPIAKTEETPPVVDPPDPASDAITKAVLAAIKKGEVPGGPTPAVTEPQADPFEQRYKDTRNYATQVQQHNVQLQEQLTRQETEAQKNRQILNQILKGLKDENIEIPMENIPSAYSDVQGVRQNVPQYTQEQRNQVIQADQARRIDSSVVLADSIHGSLEVDKYINASTGLWKKMMVEHPDGDYLMQEVQQSEFPAVQMIAQVKEWEISRISDKKAEKDYIAQIVAQVKNDIGISGNPVVSTKGGNGSNKLPTSLGNLRVASGGTTKTANEKQTNMFPEMLGGNVG